MRVEIIPKPFKTEEKEGNFLLSYNTSLELNENCGMEEHFYAKLLADTVKKETGCDLKIEKGNTEEDNVIVFERLKDDEVMPENVRTLIYQMRDENFKAPDPETEKYWRIRTESYELEIDEKKIRIAARYDRGILYGVQTLRQIVSQCKMVLPAMKIEDRPSLANRGFMHDATRARIQKTEYYKALADKASYYKLNQLQLYVEHSYMFKNFTEVWRDDTPLTAEDILELDDYCFKRGVELVPCIASFGHLDKVLKTHSFAHLCELEGSDKERFTFGGRMEHHILNISDPGAWDFVRDMLDEFMPLFSSRQFNLCGDETFDLGKGRSKALADKVGTDRMYVDFIGKIAGHLVEKGRRPLFWGDIIVSFPELLKELPEEIVCLTWGYAENEHFRCSKTMHDAGATQYICPGVHGWRHLINRLSAAYANISRMSGYAQDYNALGLLNTDWGDYGHLSDPRFSLPGLIYGAEGAWAGDLPDEGEENRRISVTEYGDRSGRIADILSRLGNCEGVAWEHMVQYQEYMTGGEHSLEEQADFFGRMHVGDVSGKNEEIASLVRELAEISGQCSESGRKIIPTYMLHAKGQMLLNTLAGTIGEKHLGCLTVGQTSENVLPGTMDPERLAGCLEKWFEEYKESWRTTSREAELYRISAIFVWYGDFLRTAFKK
ncbi:MAG: family 20 glycosylhydrolase [Lachnospiraceae bacterium]|nr:family 20 glycosylhydrolase [Lachnospiraceae bacterium]